MKNNKILITGVAGFVGYHLANLLLSEGYQILGIDNLSDYYSVDLKRDRLSELNKFSSFTFKCLDITQISDVDTLSGNDVDVIIHLAAQAGVRYSIEYPEKYLETNIYGSFNILNLALKLDVKHFLFASTSSVYGANDTMPFTESESINTPLSFYASTKSAFEMFLHSHANVYGLPVTVFRFFTVYGPFGRPDMALYKFADLMCRDKAIDVYNSGEMWRDFTYISDLVFSISRLIDINPKFLDRSDKFKKYLSPVAPYHVVNIGNSRPQKLSKMIDILEEKLQKKAKKNYLPLQVGDVTKTYADTSYLQYLIGYVPDTSLELGVEEFVKWYKEYNQIT